MATPLSLMPVCLFIAAITLAGASNPQSIFSSATYQADNYYQGRRDLANVRKALQILQADIPSHPKNYEAWWRISEYECYLARHVPDDESKTALEKGVAAGQKAEALQPNRPEGHFWTAANEGLLAEDSSLLRGLSMTDSIRDELQTVMKIDPEYQQYGAERLLGRYYYKVPFFKGGDKQRSVRMLEDCLKRYPINSLTMLYLADSYRATGRRQDAQQMLEKILHLCPDPIYGPELEDNQAEARKELQKYFHASR